MLLQFFVTIAICRLVDYMICAALHRMMVDSMVGMFDSFSERYVLIPSEEKIRLWRKVSVFFCIVTFHVIGKSLGSILRPVKSDTVLPTTRHRCDVSSELCCPVAKPRRWAPPLVTRFGVIPRV